MELLVKNASAELTTFYYYTILRVNLIGLEGEGIKEIAEVARIEDRNHFEALVEAERCAVRGYTHICNMTAGKDHRTYELSLAILNEEIEHESWFSEFLGEGPSGHYLRRGETSPFVGKFMQ